MNPHQRPGDPIKHVVLLLFENHSFDQMLGCFRQVYPGLAGVDPGNPAVNRHDGRGYRQGETTERQMILDPRHEANHVAVQMRDHNGGFVTDFIAAIRHAQAPVWQKHFAAEALGMAAGEPFHLAGQPVQAAVAWLDRHSPR